MRFLITAGPTREYFDTVRFISNPSSGRMGYALAAAAMQREHDVVLVSGPVELQAPQGVDFQPVVSAAEMFDASAHAFETSDAAIMTAAVCDYRPSRRLDHKLKKQSKPRSITLVATRDIAAHLGRIKEHRIIVAFAMEDRNQHENAERKLRKKRCDAIVLNGIANVGGDGAEVEILIADGSWTPVIRGSKIDIAHRVIRLVENLSFKKRQTDPDRET